MYAEVFQAVRNAVDQYNVHQCIPAQIVTEFELSIINVCQDVYPGVPVAGCFFHFGQLVYQHYKQKVYKYHIRTQRTTPSSSTLTY